MGKRLDAPADSLCICCSTVAGLAAKRIQINKEAVLTSENKNFTSVDYEQMRKI